MILNRPLMANKRGNGQKANGRKNHQLGCFGCGKELENDHTGVICAGDCHICVDCSKSYVNTVFEDPVQNMPLKCMSCKADVIVGTFERQLTDQQSKTFLLYHMKYSQEFLDENEIVVSCPFCDYFEINTNDPGRLLFICQSDSCRKSSCFWCKKLIKNNSDDEKKIDMDQSDVESHFICAQLAPIKQKWDKALSDGNTRSCPECGISGMKNNACTHMTCVACQTEWCYVCGLPLSKLDIADDFEEKNIFGHNEEWKTNIKRCPMWLDDLHQVDKRWPKDNSDGCVTFLHRLRTMQLLKQVINEMGDQNFKALCGRYNVHKTCGFDINRVMKDNHTLIQRGHKGDSSGCFIQ
eukprot:501069_1